MANVVDQWICPIGFLTPLVLIDLQIECAEVSLATHKVGKQENQMLHFILSCQVNDDGIGDYLHFKEIAEALRQSQTFKDVKFTYIIEIATIARVRILKGTCNLRPSPTIYILISLSSKLSKI